MNWKTIEYFVAEPACWSSILINFYYVNILTILLELEVE